MAPRVLVIDDLESARSLYERFLGAAGFEVLSRASVASALEVVGGGGADVVVTDLRMPEMDGLEGIRKIHAIDPRLPVIVVTAYATIETAVEAMRLGAVDYVRKPFEPDAMTLLVRRAIERRELERSNERLRAKVRGDARDGVVARSPAMREVVALVEKAAPTDLTVLISGETGTGKERVARLLHALSRRVEHPFVSINCCAIPESLIESELFGHARGAFSGATQERKGFLAEAGEGTLLLDEIGDLPLALQPKLLRVLQGGDYYPVGDHRLAHAQARIVCATNQDLEAQVAAGSFRPDLYYRIKVVSIVVPPLRRRIDDIPLLVREFAAASARRLGVPEPEISPEALRFFDDYPWPGNVRQLENVIERTVLVSAPGARIEITDLPAELLGGVTAPGAAGPENYEAARDSFEKEYLTRLLESAGGSVVRAARMAGLHRATLYKWLGRHGIPRGDLP